MASPPPLCELILTAADAAMTRAVAAALAPLAETGDVIALDGDLGAGKTEFARAFIRARAGRDLTVPSPTYTLVQTYDLSDIAIWHFDLYRVKAAAEIYELGLEEALASGLSLIEWPERAESLLPADRLTLRFDEIPGGPGRRLSFRIPERWRTRLADFAAPDVAA